MALLSIADSMNLRRDDPFNLFGGGGGTSAAPLESAPAAAPTGAGSTGGDAILQALMKQANDERTQMAVDAKAAEEEDRKKRLKQMIPLAIASLVAGVAGGPSARKSGGMNPGMAVFQGGLAGINAAKKDAEARRSAGYAEGLKGNEARRTELFKALGDVAKERVKASTPTAEHFTSERRNFEYGKANPDFMKFLERGGADRMPTRIREFQLMNNGRMPTLDEFAQFTQAPPSAMELFYFNELPSTLQDEYNRNRGKGGAVPSIRYDAKGNRIQ